MKTSKIQVFLAAVLVTGALLACKKGKSEETSSTTAAASGGDSTGVAECDDYLNKYQNCVKDHVPEVARAGIQQSIDTMRATYKKTAENPVTKAGLAQGCKQALEQTKTAMSQYNCEW
ncbi:MAG: hypothetical protein H6717_14350 [Polyangiaceae bacterium]|nr:hypothetical protein [Polyangiaceae bacterium]